MRTLILVIICFLLCGCVATTTITFGNNNKIENAEDTEIDSKTDLKRQIDTIQMNKEP